MKKNKVYTIEIELTESQVRSLCDQLPDNMTDGQKIAGLAGGAISDLADGGMMLSGSVTRQIIDITGGIEDQQQLVGMVEAGCGGDRGRMVGKWMIDPTYEPVLQDIAASQGLSVQQVIQSLMDWGVGQGWAYQIAPDTSVVFFLKEDLLAISAIMDKPDATGTEIAAFIRGIYEAPALELATEKN
jgi:hypothetical protein